MPASINGRALTNGEFVCVIDGVTYVGRAQEWNYIQSDLNRPTCTLGGVITAQGPWVAQPEAPVIDGARQLTVRILPWSQLPIVGDHDTLYCVSVGTGDDGLAIFEDNAYVYRPVGAVDPQPYKATNVSAEVVARLHDSGDFLPTQAAIARDALGVPVHYAVLERSLIAQLEVRTRTGFLAWIPIGWGLDEIPARSRPGLFLAEVVSSRAASSISVRHVSPQTARDELVAAMNAEIDEQTRHDLLLAAGNIPQVVTAATSPQSRLRPVVTYVSGLDDLPVQGNEHRLYCIYGYAAAYVYRRDLFPPYRPTTLSAAALAENYPNGATLTRVSNDTPTRILVAFHTTAGLQAWRAPDEQGDYFCADRLYLEISARGGPLLGRRDNTADHAFTLPADMVIPTRAVQGDSVAVTMARPTPEQLIAAADAFSARPTPQELFPTAPAIPREQVSTLARLAAASRAINQTNSWGLFPGPASSGFTVAPADRGLVVDTHSSAPSGPVLLPVIAGPRRIMRLDS